MNTHWLHVVPYGLSIRPGTTWPTGSAEANVTDWSWSRVMPARQGLGLLTSLSKLNTGTMVLVYPAIAGGRSIIRAMDSMAPIMAASMAPAAVLAGCSVAIIDASTMSWTSDAVSCADSASLTASSMDLPSSSLVGSPVVEALTASSTCLAISPALTPSGAEPATASWTSPRMTETSISRAGRASSSASTILRTSAAVSCPALADWTEALTAASTSARVTPGRAEAATAASTISWISWALALSDAESATAWDTDSFTESLTSFSISSADGPAGAGRLFLAGAGKQSRQGHRERHHRKDFHTRRIYRLPSADVNRSTVAAVGLRSVDARGARV